MYKVISWFVILVPGCLALAIGVFVISVCLHHGICLIRGKEDLWLDKW